MGARPTTYPPCQKRCHLYIPVAVRIAPSPLSILVSESHPSLGRYHVIPSPSDLDRWRQSLLAGPVDWSSSSPSTTPSPDHSHCVTPPPSSINRPSNKEEEDYQMALALSLSVSNGGPGGSNDLNTTAVRNTSNSQQLLNVLFSNTSRHARDV